MTAKKAGKKKAVKQPPEQSQELLAAIKTLNAMGYQVVSDKRAMIPETQKQDIIEELSQLEFFYCYKRLYELGLTSLKELNTEYEKRKGVKARTTREKEVEALWHAFFTINAIRDHMRDGDVKGLFYEALDLGAVLPASTRCHILTYSENKSLQAKKDGASQRKRDQKLNNEILPFVLHEAKRLREEDPTIFMDGLGRNNIVSKIISACEKRFNQDEDVKEKWIKENIYEANKDPDNPFKLPARKPKNPKVNKSPKKIKK